MNHTTRRAPYDDLVERDQGSVDVLILATKPQCRPSLAGYPDLAFAGGVCGGRCHLFVLLYLDENHLLQTVEVRSDAIWNVTSVKDHLTRLWTSTV